MKHIDSSVSKMKAIIKRGKLKHKKIKLKKEVLDKLVSPEIREKIKGADNVLKIERKAINKDNREHAHDVSADVRADLSKSVRKDLGMDIT